MSFFGKNSLSNKMERFVLSSSCHENNGVIIANYAPLSSGGFFFATQVLWCRFNPPYKKPAISKGIFQILIFLSITCGVESSFFVFSF